MRFSVVETAERLDEVLSFLARGFGWSDVRHSAFGSALRRHDEFGAYGAVLEDASGKPVIALLFFHQGSVAVDGVIKPVINLSAWYAEPAHRGLESVVFANRVIRYLRSRNCITTDYTASDAARSVLLALGLKPQSATRLRKYLWDVLPPSRRVSTPIVVGDQTPNCTSGFEPAGNIRTRRFDDGASGVTVAYTVTTVRKAGVPLRLVRILWAESYSRLTARLTKIVVTLLVHERAIAADIFIHTAIAEPDSPWLIDDVADKVHFVPPLQSEFECL